MATLAVEITGLEKRFGPHRVLKGMDLELTKGAFVHIFGANGSGKTTLLRILATLTLPTAGKVRMFGLDVKEDDVEVRAKIGFISHQPFLYNELTVMENLIFYGRMHGMHDGKIRDRAESLLERMDAIEYSDMQVGKLSRGMKQRAGIARALLHGPNMLLMDEPFTGLDKDGSSALREVLDDNVAKGATIIMTSHDTRADLSGITAVALLADGRLDGPFSKSSDGARALMAEHGRSMQGGTQ